VARQTLKFCDQTQNNTLSKKKKPKPESLVPLITYSVTKLVERIDSCGRRMTTTTESGRKLTTTQKELKVAERRRPRSKGMYAAKLCHLLPIPGFLRFENQDTPHYGTLHMLKLF
jgi:hypothetical protein